MHYKYKSQVIRKNYQKSAGLHEFFEWFCVVLFQGKSPAKKCLKKQYWIALSHELVTHMKHLHTCLALICLL